MVKINIKPDIQVVALKDIKPFSDNPRDITEESLTGLQSSLEKLGYVELLIVNKRNMVLVGGHQRLKILQKEGVDAVPCIMVDLDDMMHQVMNVTLNNQEIAGFFTQAIIPILEKIRLEMPEDYVDLRLKELREECHDLEAEAQGNTLPDDIPEAPSSPVTRAGDLWILGDHRLLCGSSTNPADVALLMAGQKAQLLATDPPYMVDYTGADRPNGGKDWSWEVDWEGKKRNSGLDHPTVKPTEIFAIPMRVHTKPGDICFEPFSGSGSQIIAAERLGRRCFAMELEPVFCDVSVKRWENFTGKEAERIINENSIQK